jgi:hypothetical protein
MIEDKLENIMEELAFISEKCGESNNFVYLENIEFAFQHLDLALFKAKTLSEAPTLQ